MQLNVTVTLSFVDWPVCCASVYIDEVALMVQPKTNLCSGARLMSPNDTFQKLQRIHLSFKKIINKAKDTTNTLNNVDSDLPDMTDPLM